MAKNEKKKLEQKIVAYLKRKKSGATPTEISRHLQISKKNYRDFRNTLERLHSSGKLLRPKGTKKYLLVSKSRLVRGELRIARAGYGFVQDTEVGVDIFINRDHLNTAFDGDLVEVKLYARSRGKNEDGFVDKVLERRKKQFVGTFHKTDYYGYVVPDDPRVYRDFYIPNEKQKDARQGQKVVVLLEKWDTDHLNPEGTIHEVIGYPGEPGVDVASVAHSFELNIKFSDRVEEDALRTDEAITEKDIAGRMDLRDLICFTIDPSDAKDFDDAISLEALENGHFRLGVHIADVSHYVPENSPVDKEAMERGTSVYLVDRVIPMMPEHLSNRLCSLEPEKDKLTYSCLMDLNSSGEVLEYEITPSIIHSKRRFNYQEVQAIVDGQKDDVYQDKLRSMMDLSKKLKEKRFESGGIDFETPEVYFELDDKGFPQKISLRERLDSHRLVEEFMLLANKTVARHIKKISPRHYELPFIYRVHEKPDPEKIEKLFDLLSALGYKYNFTVDMTSRELQNILEDIKGKKEQIIIEEVALRSMMKAIYDTKNIGHYGLGFEDYTHFTSPIRRYPDLTVHRLLRRYKATTTPQETRRIPATLGKICQQATKMERIAMEAERESVRLKKNEYISRHVGEQFSGIISGVTAFGVFVELLDTLVEGLIHVKDMDDYFIYEEKTYTLIGRDSGKRLQLGDEVEIEVARVDLESGKVDFRLVNSS